jgi:predicted AlkP superfamily pyrophosphatase or phosphodiesterase
MTHVRVYCDGAQDYISQTIPIGAEKLMPPVKMVYCNGVRGRFKNNITRWLTTLAILAGLVAHDVNAETSGKSSAGSGGVNSAQQQDKPYLILVSIDGFRWDYMDLYSTPNLSRIAAAGVRAERLLPVFPTLTFPNHYSIATGLYPANHGLVGNEFPDHARNKWYALHDRESVEDRWFYQGEPIWVTAETQGMVAASFFFVGTEAPIQGVYPSHWRPYEHDIAGEERVDQVLSWLAKPAHSRPHLYTLYFEDVDDYSHWFGPGSPESIEAIKRVDSYLGRLMRGLATLPHGDRVNIIVVSDHGQGEYLKDQPAFTVDEFVDLSGITSIDGGSYLFLYFNQDDPARANNIVSAINSNWQHGTAYLPSEAPAGWHIDDNPRYPDVLLMPDAGFAVLSSLEKAGKMNSGDHGWIPEMPEMHGFFIASGPNINPGISLGSINNIDIYPLMVGILRLQAPDKLDGDASTLSGVLRRE